MKEARERGLLRVRVRPMMRVGSEQTTDQAIALISGLGARSGFGDDWLRIWGLKMVLDGGVEGAALEEPYADDPANFGHLNWDPAALTRVCTEAARSGWKIGTHAVGDRAVRITPGKLADLVGYSLDPLAADPDDLAELTPTFTITGGRAVHDPSGMLGS